MGRTSTTRNLAYNQHYDEEVGGENPWESDEADDVFSSSDAFDIPPKNAPIERLTRWRVKRCLHE